jgi:hypothetical protein
MNSIRISLYTTYYKEGNPKRRLELESAIIENINNEVFSKIVILNEGGDLSFINSDKVTIIPIEQRPEYIDFFNLINMKANAYDISIVANTDISFDKNIEILKYLDLSDTCFALSRWNLQSNRTAKLYNHCDSQDSWIFKGKIKDLICDFPLGVARCDNRILYELRIAGYKVLNPAFSIKSYHHHNGIRTPYNSDNLPSFVNPPYAYLYPHNYSSIFKTIYFNSTHSFKLAPYRYDIKKVNKWILVRISRFLLKRFFHYNLPLIGYI